MKYKMGLQEKYFKMMQEENKKIEIRLCDQKRKELKVGDIIEFSKEPERIEKIDTIITEIKKYYDFEQALENLPINLITTEEKSNYLKDLDQFYPKKLQEEYGVLAIKVENVKKYEKSCGTVVFKKENEKDYVLLVHHNLGHWGIPKGHVEKDETEEETAKREVLEETGIHTSIINGFRESITYSPKKETLKEVVFFIGNAKNTETTPQLEEVGESCFIELEESLLKITYENEKQLLEKAINYYKRLK